ncbi:hypothetical protein HOY82DRAFT_523489 [Tuber indicum]|nr:hypothetical protein HOY82DRAFT_523489 [Tuber indicum]
MISTISRCARTPGWQLAAANSIRTQPFTAKAPRFNEKPLERSNGQSSEQSNERPNERLGGPSAPTMVGPTLRRVMLPIDRVGRTASADVIACINEEEMEEILLGRTRYLYRKFFFHEYTRHVWLYVKRPVGKLAYVAEIGGCKHVPEELEMLPYYTNKRMESLREARAADEKGTISRGAGEGAVDGRIEAPPKITYCAGNLRRFELPGLPSVAYAWDYLRGAVGKGILAVPATSEIYQCPGSYVVVPTVGEAEEVVLRT